MATGLSWTHQVLTIAAGLVFLLHSISSQNNTNKNENYKNLNCKPPSLSKQGDALKYFIVNEEVHIFCIAEGKIKLKYSWLKNDEPLDSTSEENSERIVMRKDGTLVFIDPKEEDAGYYQCKVVNNCGTSLSVKTHLMHAKADPFPLLDKPSEVKGVVGTYVKLKCDPPASTPLPAITWILDESRSNTNQNPIIRKAKLQSVELNDRVTMDYEGNLHITDLKHEDAQDGKTYICQAENLFTRSSNKGADKIIKVTGQKPTIQGVKLKWHSETNVVALEGNDLSMKCIFAGHPTPQVDWKRLDGQMVSERMTKLNHELLIKKVIPSDEGKYVCEGFNSAGSRDSKEFYVTVDARPSVHNPPVDKIVGPEEDEEFSCKANGKPEPVVEWFINGKPLAEVEDPKRVLKDNVLYFSKLEQKDSQVVQCNVSNPHGYIWYDASLYVQAEAPIITQMPEKNIIIAEKQALHISCTMRGRPRPVVTWSKGAQALKGDRFDIQKNGDLKIKNVNKKDTGNYKCEARNKFGKAWGFSDVEVREATEILQKPQSQNVTSSDDVTFKCGAKTDPKETEKLKYKWLKDGIQLSNSSRVTVYERKLVIRDTSSKDTASYTCVADNGLDSDTATAQLRVEAVPDAPGNVTLTACNPKQAKISWTFTDSMRNFLPMEKFVVESRTTVENTTGNWQEKTQALPTDREATITLSPWAQYTFRVRAVNTMGISQPSMATTPVCKTLRASPDKNPGKVETDERHTGFLVIKWEPMKLLDLNAPNFTYIVEYQKQGDSDFTVHRVEDYRTGEYKVEVDDVYQAYTVRVRAENSVGRALQNAPTKTGFSGQGVPLVVPENFERDESKNVTATSAWFKWDAVNTSVDAMQGKFSGYKIRFWKAGQKETTLHAHIIEPKVSSRRRRRRRRQSPDDDDEEEDGKVYGVVANLPSFSEIEVDVVAINEFFESNGSNVVTIKTPEGVPGPVAYFKAISRGSHHFVLEWETPKEPNGIIRKYEISYSRLQGIDLEPRVLAFPGLSPDTQRVVLRGLQPNSAYQIYIRAHTDEGAGTEYPIDVRTHSIAVELARPVVLDVMAGETDANVTFEVPTPGSGLRLGQIYKVWYKPKKEDNWKEHENILAEGETWVTLNHLEPSTQYEVKVTAQAHEKDTFTDSDTYPFRTSGVVTISHAGVALSLTSGDPSDTDDNKSDQAQGELTLAGATQATFLTAAWFIGMMVAIAILLILLIIVCIIKRNRGDNYPVQEKERLRGTYDEQPDHFNGFGKVEENGLGGSAGSLDQEKLPLDAESDSLDYGDDDASKFNEDGSFIGQYGRGEKAGDPTNASSIV